MAAGRGTTIRLHSAAFDETVELPSDAADPLEGWGRYVAAVHQLLRERGMPPAGLDGEIVSTVPIGAGLSSSAALTVSVGLALYDCRLVRAGSASSWRGSPRPPSGSRSACRSA